MFGNSIRVHLSFILYRLEFFDLLEEKLIYCGNRFQFRPFGDRMLAKRRTSAWVPLLRIAWAKDDQKPNWDKLWHDEVLNRPCWE